MDARETAKRHGEYVCAGNMQAVGADFVPGALDEFVKHGKRTPRGANKHEIVSESQEGDHHIFDIKYSNDAQESLTIRSKWGKQGDDWKIVSAEPV